MLFSLSAKSLLAARARMTSSSRPSLSPTSSSSSMTTTTTSAPKAKNTQQFLASKIQEINSKKPVIPVSAASSSSPSPRLSVPNPIGYRTWEAGMERRYKWPLFGLKYDVPLPLPTHEIGAITRSYFGRGARWLGSFEDLSLAQQEMKLQQQQHHVSSPITITTSTSLPTTTTASKTAKLVPVPVKKSKSPRNIGLYEGWPTLTAPLASLVPDTTTTSSSSTTSTTTIEVAFVGRANAGKSALLNILVGSKDGKFVPIGKKPGSTQSVDLYELLPSASSASSASSHPSSSSQRQRLVLVDTPGYGHAARGKDNHAEWMKSVSKYLKQRGSGVGGGGLPSSPGSSSGGGGGGGGFLRRVILLADARLGLTLPDLQVLEMLNKRVIPCMVVLTKCDLVTSTAALEHTAFVTAGQLMEFQNPFPMLHTCSSVTGEGMVDLVHSLGLCVGG